MIQEIKNLEIANEKNKIAISYDIYCQFENLSDDEVFTPYSQLTFYDSILEAIFDYKEIYYIYFYRLKNYNRINLYKNMNQLHLFDFQFTYVGNYVSNEELIYYGIVKSKEYKLNNVLAKKIIVGSMSGDIEIETILNYIENNKPNLFVNNDDSVIKKMFEDISSKNNDVILIDENHHENCSNKYVINIYNENKLSLISQKLNSLLKNIKKESKANEHLC